MLPDHLSHAKWSAQMRAKVVHADHLPIWLAPQHQLFTKAGHAQRLTRLHFPRFQDYIPLVPDHLANPSFIFRDIDFAVKEFFK
jgi:hypothetical protein